eukprot:3940188-Pyramimonas_sp.AAC.1
MCSHSAIQEGAASFAFWGLLPIGQIEEMYNNTRNVCGCGSFRDSEPLARYLRLAAGDRAPRLDAYIASWRAPDFGRLSDG